MVNVNVGHGSASGSRQVHLLFGRVESPVDGLVRHTGNVSVEEKRRETSELNVDEKTSPSKAVAFHLPFYFPSKHRARKTSQYDFFFSVSSTIQRPKWNMFIRLASLTRGIHRPSSLSIFVVVVLFGTQ